MYVRNFRLANFEGLRKYLKEIDWELERETSHDHDSEPPNIDSYYDKFLNILHSGQDTFIPVRKNRNIKNDPPWMNERIKFLIGRQKGIYRKIKRGDENLRNEYNQIKREVKKYIRRAKRQLEIKAAKEAKTNPKVFYNLYKTQSKDRIGPLKNVDGQITSANDEMGMIFNQFFSSVFTDEILEQVPMAPLMFNELHNNGLTDILVSKEEVINEVHCLKKHKSPGPDEVFARTLKECSKEVSEQLTNIFNKSLELGEVPETWKQANVVPIYKNKGDRSLASNYRPISLTSTVGKLLESIIAKHIRKHLDRYGLINESQHGFTKGRSCLTNLLSFYSEVYKAVDNGKAYDIIYLDFSKAFDRVPHERLIRKVEAHGIRGNISKWIKAWLTGRRQRVSINGTKSEWADVKSGVPQGSVLGPLLFIIYINDLDTEINSRLSKFADDTKIGRAIHSDDDANALQRDLDNLCEWTDKWQMRFNTEKCKVINVGRTNDNNNYKLVNDTISHSSCERDLGVMVTKDLKPRQQCIKVRNKANRILGFISRSVSNRTDKVILQLYLALVRPHLDYAVQFWCPAYKMDIHSLESVQRRMTKMIHSIRNLPYEERLKRLNLHSLERRRVRGDLIEVYKWMTGINKGDIGSILIVNQENRTRNNGFKLDKFKFKREIGKNWFGNRVVDEWNKLPNEIITAKTVSSFKNRLDKYMDSKRWV